MISIDEADALAERAHDDDRNKFGVLFIDHVRSVADHVRSDPDPYAVPAALLHDTVENGRIGWDDLRAAGADDRLIAVVDALTAREGEPEAVYLSRCADDPLALRIKRADIRDKFDTVEHSPVPEPRRAELVSQAKRRMNLLESFATAR